MKKLKKYLLKLITKGTEGQGRVIPKRSDQAVKASIQPGQKGKRKLGTAKGKIHIREDFDEPLDEFSGYA
jgi:hypothetical protein